MKMKVWRIMSYIWIYWHRIHGQLMVDRFRGCMVCTACGRRRYPPKE